jgi:uncharacterized protein (TIGR02231 family)
MTIANRTRYMPDQRKIKRVLIPFVFLFLLPFLAISTSHAQNNSQVVNTRIVSVTVYPETALIKKAVILELKKGDNTATLSGLTPEIIDDSIQISSSDPDINILDIKVSETFLSEFQQEEVKRLKSSLEEVERAILIKSAEKDALKLFSSTIEKYSPQSKEQQIDISAINSYFELIEKVFKRTGRAIAEIEEELKKLNKEKERLENELRSYGQKKEKTKVLLISLYSKKDTRGTVEVSYLVQGAGWRPGYNLKVNSNTNKYVIEYLAMISQNSGEDWKDTEVIVSTRKPASFRDIPVPSPWYVDRAERREVLPFLRKGLALTREAPEKEFEKKGVAPEIKEELASVNFILPGGINIPSDGRSHRIVLASQQKDTVIKYITVPRNSPYAYLKTEFENPFTYPVLPGEVRIYLDNRFAGEILLNKALYPGEKREMPLGIDERIKVERKLTRKFTEYQGTFTKETAISYEYTTGITNGTSKEIELEFKDNLPVSRNEKIKIEIREPKDRSMIKEDGSYALLLKLKSGETHQLKTSFTVIFPRDWEITGVE